MKLLNKKASRSDIIVEETCKKNEIKTKAKKKIVYAPEVRR
jgi:hypothetical protein